MKEFQTDQKSYFTIFHITMLSGQIWSMIRY